MKITHLIQMAGIGGAEIHLLTLLPELVTRGLAIEVILVVLDKDREQESLLSEPLKKPGLA